MTDVGSRRAVQVGRDRAQEALSELLFGGRVARLVFSGLYSIEFVRTTNEGKLPTSIRLTIFADWSVASPAAWEELLRSPLPPPWNAAPVEARKAFAMAAFCAASPISLVEVGEDGRISLVAGPLKLAIAGHDDVFEESWIVDVPADLSDSYPWSVVCTSAGDLYLNAPEQSAD